MTESKDDSNVIDLRKPDHWAKTVKGMLKAELKRRDIGYADLVVALAKIDVRETEASIANKISRGSFPATFLIQCLTAIGCETLRIKD